jgi:hypothetical protein
MSVAVALGCWVLWFDETTVCEELWVAVAVAVATVVDVDGCCGCCSGLWLWLWLWMAVVVWEKKNGRNRSIIGRVTTRWL